MMEDVRNTVHWHTLSAKATSIKISIKLACQNLYVPTAMHDVAKGQKPNPVQKLTKICAWSKIRPVFEGSATRSQFRFDSLARFLLCQCLGVELIKMLPVHFSCLWALHLQCRCQKIIFNRKRIHHQVTIPDPLVTSK